MQLRHNHQQQDCRRKGPWLPPSSCTVPRLDAQPARTQRAAGQWAASCSSLTLSARRYGAEGHSHVRVMTCRMHSGEADQQLSQVTVYWLSLQPKYAP